MYDFRKIFKLKVLRKSVEVLIKIRDYWDKRARDYDRAPGHSGFEEEWKKFLSGKLSSESKILDVGTGTGFLALLLAELGYEVVGVDISEEMIKVAREKAEKRNLKVEFKLGNAEKLDFKNEEFDAVVSRHLLWTLQNLKNCIAEWKRVTKNKVLVIDGVWLSDNFVSRVKSGIAKLGIALVERRNVFKLQYDKDTQKALPYYGGVPKDVALRMFREVGFSKIEVEDLNYLKELFYKGRFLYKLAWYGRDYYSIIGVK